MITYAIVAKPNHELAPPLIEVAVSFIKKTGANFIIDSETENRYKSLKCLSLRTKVVERKELSSLSNCIIILGGDGTLISVCRHPSKKPTDIIGVNLGTLGFLTEIAPEELLSTLTAYDEGKTKRTSRPLLCVEVLSDSNKSTFHAMNDVVVSKQALARVFGVKLKIEGDEAASIRGDGIIISTPAGSTAYSLAAGGSIVHPEVDALLVTPICPHSLTARPLIVPGESLIEIELGSDCRAESVFLTVDGQEGFALQKGTIIKISKSNYKVSFIKSLNKNYFGTLSTKLRWG